jgi:undecaprenyl-diphosphatase
MLEIIKSLVFGVVQGVTEWLPVSSTAHLLLLDEFFSLSLSEAAMEFYLIIIQLASILALVILHFSYLNPFSLKKTPQQRSQTWQLLCKIGVATVPAAVAGVVLDRYMEAYLHRWSVIATALFTYGMLYIFLERGPLGRAERKAQSLEKVSYRQAIFLGCFQVLALIPGTSRSGSTILGGLILGLDRTVATQFSFYMAIPVMLGASLLKVVKLGITFTTGEYLIIAAGSLVSFTLSLLVIRAMLSYIKKHDFTVFGIYRILLSIAMAIYFVGLAG